MRENMSVGDTNPVGWCTVRRSCPPALRIHTVAVARPGAAGAAGALVGVGLGDGRDGERVHADARVVPATTMTM